MSTEELELVVRELGESLHRAGPQNFCKGAYVDAVKKDGVETGACTIRFPLGLPIPTAGVVPLRGYITGWLEKDGWYLLGWELKKTHLLLTVSKERARAAKKSSASTDGKRHKP